MCVPNNDILVDQLNSIRLDLGISNVPVVLLSLTDSRRNGSNIIFYTAGA